MTLKEIAAIAGKSGLFRVIKPTRNGVILESIDELKVKSIANNSTRVSILSEISMYTTGAENSKPLSEVFKSIFTKYGTQIGVSLKSDSNELGNFLESVLPNYDKERIYHSDIKKLVNWYSILVVNYPELLTNTEQEASKETIETNNSSDLSLVEVAAEEPAKPKAKKTSAKKKAE